MEIHIIIWGGGMLTEDDLSTKISWRHLQEREVGKARL